MARYSWSPLRIGSDVSVSARVVAVVAVASTRSAFAEPLPPETTDHSFLAIAAV